MVEKLINWTVVIISIVLGLGFLLNNSLIPNLPVMLHWILGIILVVTGGYLAYKLA